MWFEELFFNMIFAAVAVGAICNMIRIWRSGEARDPGGGGWSALLRWWLGVSGRAVVAVAILLTIVAVVVLLRDR